MFDHNEDEDTMEAPKHDMVIVRFHGDNFDVVLPYCEVANGVFTHIDEASIHIELAKEGKMEKVAMSYVSFVEVVESTFDIKEVVSLSVQPKGSYETYKVL